MYVRNVAFTISRFDHYTAFNYNTSHHKPTAMTERVSRPKLPGRASHRLKARFRGSRPKFTPELNGGKG